LVLGLGCENNHIEGIQQAVANQGGAYDESRIRYLSLQDCEDEIEEGLTQLAELAARMATDARTEVPISKLKVGVKCGGSDGYSGITANPLIGSVSDMLALWGASILMTELPEAFGAEEILLARASSQAVFDAAAEMLTDFRRYYIAHGEKISENPSPGNIAGGITTLEEKALGCVQKAGQVPLCGVAKIGETATAQGLTLVDGPGNDLVAITHLLAAGANVILFSTGRGTPLSAPIPTIKISTNSALAKKKAHWIDFDAGACLMVDDTELYRKSLFIHTLGVASGTPTRAEENGYYDIALFKRGVTL
jgi:altronate hydrolase